MAEYDYSEIDKLALSAYKQHKAKFVDWKYGGIKDVDSYFDLIGSLIICVEYESGVIYRYRWLDDGTLLWSGGSF